MRVALFSDVHGNLTGLEAVLADIERQAPDLIIFAGDLCFLGPRPAECLRRVRDRRLPGVVGNTDEWVTGRTPPPEPRRAAAEWTHAQLTAGERDWLGRLPFALRLSPTARAADDLLIVHANPRDVNGIIFPPVEMQMRRDGHARQSDEELRPLLEGIEAAVVAYGHLHIPSIRPWGTMTLVNISSVSHPGDEDARAKYGLLTFANGRWSAEHRRVSYDVAGEAAAFHERQPPDWQAAVAAIETDGYYYPQKV